MKTILFAGSFDPFTVGHADLVQRALQFMDIVHIAIGENQNKTALFSLDERLAAIRHTYQDESRVEVSSYKGLTVDKARTIGAAFLLRGIRNAVDTEREWALATFNRDLSGIETILLPTDKEYAHISSSLVRDILRNGSDASAYLP